MKGASTSSHLKIRIIGGMNPTDYKKKGWGQFDVEVIGKSGKYVFQGKPDTCSRNFFLSGTFKCSAKNVLTTKGELTYEKINPTTITVDEMNYFMCELELPPVEARAMGAIFDRLPMPVAAFRALPVFPMFETACDYFRIEFEIPLKVALENQKGIRALDGPSLVAAHAMLSNYPWKLCFDRHASQFKLKEMTYKGFHTYRIRYKKVVQPLFLQAIRLYSFMRESDDEVFQVETLFKAYLSHPTWGPIAYENNDKDMRPAFDFLMFHGLCNANYKPDAPLEYVSYPKQIQTNRDVIGSFENMAGKQRLEPRHPDEVYVPCKPSNTLSDVQASVVGHALTNHLTFCEGAPGTGKTEVLVAIMAEISRRNKVDGPPRGPLVGTYIGMMVDALQRRFGGRPETANTIHFICCKVEANPDDTWIHQFNVLVIDEGSNVDIKLFARLLRCLPNLAQLVMVGDLGQIFPIKKGCPFFDLTKTFPQHSFMLLENKRVDPDSLQLAQAATLIRSGESHKIEFSAAGASSLSLMGRETENLLETILERYVRVLDDTMKMQFVTLRNMERKRLNTQIEDILLRRGILKKPAQCYYAAGCALYAGKKIMFNKTHKEMLAGFNGVRNGEMCQIKSVKGNVIETTNGKKIMLGLVDGCVDPASICNGYATTCNKAQGSEWENIVFWIYENPNRFFTREFPYVAISRAKKQCIVVGTKEEFDFLCAAKARERNTLLRYYLFLEGFGPLEEVRPPGPLVDPAKLRFLPPNVLAIPVPKVADSAKRMKR